MRTQIGACLLLFSVPLATSFAPGYHSQLRLREQHPSATLCADRSQQLGSLGLSASAKDDQIVDESTGSKSVAVGKFASVLAAGVIGFAGPKPSQAEMAVQKDGPAVTQVQEASQALNFQLTPESKTGIAVTVGTVGAMAAFSALKKRDYTFPAELIDKASEVIEAAEACPDRASAMKILQENKAIFERMNLQADGKMSINSLPGRLYAIESRSSYPSEAIAAATRLIEQAEACKDKAAAMKLLDEGKQVLANIKVKADASMSSATLPGRLAAIQARPSPLPPKGPKIQFNQPKAKAATTAEKKASAPAISDDRSEAIKKRVGTELETAGRLLERAVDIIERAEACKSRDGATRVLKEGKKLFKSLNLAPDAKMSSTSLPGRLHAVCAKWGISDLTEAVSAQGSNFLLNAIGSLFGLGGEKKKSTSQSSSELTEIKAAPAPAVAQAPAPAPTQASTPAPPPPPRATAAEQKKTQRLSVTDDYLRRLDQLQADRQKSLTQSLIREKDSL